MRLPQFTAEQALSTEDSMDARPATSEPRAIEGVLPQIPSSFGGCYRYWRDRGFSRLTSVISCL
jgi:hypothetical protein